MFFGGPDKFFNHLQSRCLIETSETLKYGYLFHYPTVLYLLCYLYPTSKYQQGSQDCNDPQIPNPPKKKQDKAFVPKPCVLCAGQRSLGISKFSGQKNILLMEEILQNPVDNGINYRSTGAGVLPSTVSFE